MSIQLGWFSSKKLKSILSTCWLLSVKFYSLGCLEAALKLSNLFYYWSTSMITSSFCTILLAWSPIIFNEPGSWISGLVWYRSKQQASFFGDSILLLVESIYLLAFDIEMPVTFPFTKHYWPFRALWRPFLIAILCFKMPL